MQFFLKNPFFTKGYSVRLRLVFFVSIAVLLVLFISISAVIGLNSTNNALSDLRQRSQNEMLLSMTLGVKTTQISTYAMRLSQTVRALEYQEASKQLASHIEQVDTLLNTAKQNENNRLFIGVAGHIEMLEKTVQALLLQAHQRHILNTTMISALNQSLLHIRHIKRLVKHRDLPPSYLPQLLNIERLIEEAVHNPFSLNGFSSIQALFHFLPDSRNHNAIFEEWKKVEAIFEQLPQHTKQLVEVNGRIQYLIYKINALTHIIDKNYTQLAQQNIETVKSNAEQAQYQLKRHQQFILLFAFFTVLGIVVLGCYIYHLIGKRLYSITDALTQLSRGNKNVSVPQQQRQDEIGNLARAFHIFYQQVITLDKTDALLKEKSALLEQTYSAMRDGLAIFDEQLELCSCNDQFVRLLQQERGSLRQSLAEQADFLAQHNATVYGTQQPISIALLQEVRTEQEPLEIAFNQQIFEWRISPLQEGGLVALLIDRTQRKKLEIDLAHSQKMQTIGHLTGGIAHDFNNFLAIIIGNLTLIDPESLHERQAKRLHRALKAAENSAVLTQRLLSYARKQPLYPSAVDINQLLLGFCDLMKHSLPANIPLHLHLAEDLPLAYIDRNQLETALVNLIVNAKDAICGEGEIHIRSEQKRVQRTHRQEQMIQITLQDNGAGMSEETQKRVFEPFFTTKKQNKGSGLGLSMVYGFIRQSKGRIHIHSEIGKGTTIYLQLPLAPHPKAQISSPPENTAHTRQGARILIVEDQPALRETLCEQLAQQGYLPLAVESAEQAVRSLQNFANIDYVLSDIVLTGKWSGMDLAHFVRNNYPHIHIVLMSGNHTEAGAHHAFPILTKPFQQEDLLNLLQGSK